ncbi:hypothetical protein C0J52_04624 [Blattella germanica]|nr:hypothetical protein C0J52_04624 [Blattella germanica]
MVFQRSIHYMNKGVAVILTSRSTVSNLLKNGRARWFSSTTKTVDAEIPNIPDERRNLIQDNDLTVTEMKERGRLYMGLDRGFKPLQRPRAHLLQLLPESQDELPERKMCVVYTEFNHMQIAVFADVLDPVSSETFTTNTFQFTFENPVQMFRILPRSYSGNNN